MSKKLTIEQAFDSKPLFLRSEHNYDTAQASNDSGLKCEDVSLTQQQFKDDNNPNLIMEKYARTGDEGLFMSASAPKYADFSDAVDYQTSLNRITEANNLFAGLSATIRARFENNPALFLQFVNNPDNKAEAVKLGLIKKDSPSTQPTNSGVEGESKTPSKVDKAASDDAA